MTTAIEYANGLRALADYLEAQPASDLPETTLSNYYLDEKEDAARVLKAMKPCAKEYHDEYFYIVRNFGPIRYEYVFTRSKVCTPRVVGTRVIDAHTIPEKVTPAQEVPERTEDIIEWDCGEPLLAKPTEVPYGGIPRGGPDETIDRLTSRETEYEM